MATLRGCLPDSRSDFFEPEDFGAPGVCSGSIFFEPGKLFAPGAIYEKINLHLRQFFPAS